MLRQSLMHHNKTSQYTIIRTHCRSFANIDNHFAIRNHFGKKIKKGYFLPRQAPRPDWEQRLSEALTTTQTLRQTPPSGPGAADLRDADSSKYHTTIQYHRHSFQRLGEPLLPVRSRPQPSPQASRHTPRRISRRLTPSRRVFRKREALCASAPLRESPPSQSTPITSRGEH